MTRIGQGAAANLSSKPNLSNKGVPRVIIEINLEFRRAVPLLLAGTILAGLPHLALAQAPATPPAATPPAATPPAATVANAPAAGSLLNPTPPPPVVVVQPTVIKSIRVEGAQRVEPETVLSYVKLRVGQTYTAESGDDAIRDLFATELFADASIRDDNGTLTIIVRENPIINRVVFEGNKRLKDDKLNKELKLAPRQIFTRSKVRADIARIVELYRRQGRFAAVVEPKMVMLDQNRVDLIYEVSEGPKSKVRAINIVGNEKFSDGRLRGEMVTKRASLLKLLSSGTSYDPDRLAYDQAKLRQFYLTQGYADFRVVSAVAELTPDKRDFIITYVVEEGERYKFGDVTVESEIRDFTPAVVKPLLPMKKGDWYDAKLVEDTVENVTKSAGLFGYAFAQVDPQFQRDKETRTMNLTFRIGDAPRVYVERIDVNGNTLTQDKVVRREFRLAEGDAFNAFSVKRSEERIKSLGFFQEKFEVQQSQGSAPDRIVLAANVEEKATGSLQLSAGYSSLEKFLINASIEQRNFRGKGQVLRLSAAYSTYSKSIEAGFTEPYLFDRNIALGVDVFRRDINSFSFDGTQRNTTFKQTSTGFQARVGVPITEYWQLAGRYGLSYDQVTLDQNTYYFNGACDPLIAGRYLCDAIGNRITSSVGYSLVFSNLNNGIRPTSGQRFVFSQDFAGLGGDIKYLKSRFEGAKYWNVGRGFIASARVEGGYVAPLQSARSPTSDAILLTDRFFLGEPQMRGFDIRGVGPRVLRYQYNPDGTLNRDKNQTVDDALGGRAYYLGRLELEIPLGAGVRELGLRPSIFVDAGAVFRVKNPTYANGGLQDQPLGVLRCRANTTGTTAGAIRQTTLYADVAARAAGRTNTCDATSETTAFTLAPFQEQFFGDTPSPRVAIGIGVNWNSPFGPFRIDVSKVLLKQPGDQTKTFSFNVGTQF